MNNNALPLCLILEQVDDYVLFIDFNLKTFAKVVVDAIDVKQLVSCNMMPSFLRDGWHK